MKIRCRECKTIYDNGEKYCPFCYARTYPDLRVSLQVDNDKFAGFDALNKAKRDKVKQDSFDGVADRKTKSTFQSTSAQRPRRDNFVGMKDRDTLRKVKNKQTAEEVTTLIILVIFIMVILSMFF